MDLDHGGLGRRRRSRRSSRRSTIPTPTVYQLSKLQGKRQAARSYNQVNQRCWTPLRKSRKLNERRAARLVQMRLMEEAASGTLPLPPLPASTGSATSTGSAGSGGGGGGTTDAGAFSSAGGVINDTTIGDRDYNFGTIMGTSNNNMVGDIESNAAASAVADVGTFVVEDASDDDDDDDDSSPFSSSLPSDHLWHKPSLSPNDSPTSSPVLTSTAYDANTTMGEDGNSMPPPGSVWRNWKWTSSSAEGGGGGGTDRNIVEESRELILMASRRLNQDGPILSRHQAQVPSSDNANSNSDTNNNINLHGFHADYNEDDEYENYHRQRGRYIKLPMCCFTFHRHIIASVMILTLLILLLGVLEPFAHSKDDSSGVQPPWSGSKENQNNGKDGGGGTTFTAISNPEKFNRIKDRLLERSISHASSLEDTTSPQYKALVWIVNEDQRQLDLPDVEEDDDEVVKEEEESLLNDGGGEDGKTNEQRTLTEDEAAILLLENEHALFQRYALATLYYQTTDLHIVRQSLTGQHVEDPFELPFNPLDLQKEDIVWKNSENWLSGLGYCAWHGISCHSRSGDGGGQGSASAVPESENDDYYVSGLNLTNNNLNGILPHELYTAFPKLQVIDISKNEMGGTIGREVGLLVHLQDLFISENDFSGVIPNDIGKLSNLYNLYMNDNMFRGSIPAGMGNLMELRSLSMFNNSITGTIPNSFGNLQNVIALYLDDNKLTGTIPKALGQMYNMIDLRLRRNELSGTIPTELGYLTELETLYLDTNPKLNGMIPAELSKLEKLNELHLYMMNLSGPLPSELGLLDGLVFLYLDANELTGTIPEEWGQMRDLEELFITGNNLSGQLPVTMRGLTSLRSLRAADNELSGPIPSDMGKMLKLEYVYLEGNDFSGKVPSELGQLTKLKLMHLHGNNFSGLAPEICKLSDNFVLSDLMADCESITCTCCACP